MAASSYAVGSAITLALWASIGSAAPIASTAAPSDAGAPIDLVAACTTQQRASLCYPDRADASTGGICLGKCLAGIHTRADQAKIAAQEACEAKVVANEGKGRFTCGTVSLAVKREDPAKLEALFIDAVKARSLVELDAIVTRMIAADAYDREVACSNACNERGHSRLRAPKEAPALVRAYKLCMLQTDGAPEARKFAAYDRDLYDELIAKANDRCRAANKCDWLEEFSNLECTYGRGGG